MDVQFVMFLPVHVVQYTEYSFEINELNMLDSVNMFASTR